MLLRNLAIGVAVSGLVDDDFGMELLVGGAIVSLSLPVRLVWECVWRLTLPAAGSETSGRHSTQPCCSHPCACTCASACSMLFAKISDVQLLQCCTNIELLSVVTVADSLELDSLLCQ